MRKVTEGLPLFLLNEIISDHKQSPPKANLKNNLKKTPRPYKEDTIG